MNRVDGLSWGLRVDAAASARDTVERKGPTYTCDRCGARMYELNCKVICPNCGSRFDCSDLNVYFDEPAD